jgi:multidrug efflux pump
MIARFFIDRPIFATVLSVVITLTGAIALFALPMAQYPQITPPSVQVSCNYPGANAQVVADTVGAPIEQQVNGVQGMLYMSSQSGNDGSYTLTVTFDIGTDLNTALVMVQNRVALALPQLPTQVQQQSLTVRKKTPDLLLIVSFFSPDQRYDDIYLSNYATINVRDELLRVEGVSDISVLGQRDYSIRVWLDPMLLASRNITASEVAAAVRTQNVEVALGQIGQPPFGRVQPFELPVDTLGRLRTTEQFADIIVKVAPGGAVGQATPSLVRLGDVARIELGATNYNTSSTYDQKPAVGLAVFQLPGTNALDVAERIRTRMEELRTRFPDGLEYEIGYDTTPFIRESVMDVVYTLLEAVVLVAIVVLVFLQNWRAALIPLVAVPVAIVGTFAVMVALGFSLNNLTLFGLVLAIGIVVDDAIVVVENVERWLEYGLAPREAARKAMDEVTGPVIAVALVLCAVFVPCAFLGGITGQFFRQFAVTIAASTVISAFNSLTLSPALAAILLKPRGAKRDPLTWLVDVVLGWFFWLFNWTFNAGTALYVRIVGGLLYVSVVVLVVYGGLLGLTWFVFRSAPTGFVPQQDQGRLLVSLQLPDSASRERTVAALAKAERIAHQTPGVAHTTTISGMSFVLQANSPNLGSMFIVLDPFDERQRPELKADAIMAHLQREFTRRVDDAAVTVFGAPPIPGLGVAGGFKLMVEDRGGLGARYLQTQTDNLATKLQQAPGVANAFGPFRSNTPQLFMDIDRTRAESLGVPLDEVNQTLVVYLGSLYVNSFNAFGRLWQVTLQAEGKYRTRAEYINQLQVRNADGDMVPLGALVDVREIGGPITIQRYNLYTAAPINGNFAPDASSGDVIATVDEVARRNLPRIMSTEWTELMFVEIRAGNTALGVFALAVVFVFLALAALYESWSLPLAVILVVPLCLLCSVAGVLFTHTAVNIFVQIGLVVLVGLACKNAILIVEFARELRHQGKSSHEATLEACRLRLRPILMTSFAFILGVVPLVLASGAGAEMRRSLGVAVFSGMLGVTAFGIFLTPVFFHVIEWLGETRLLSRLVKSRAGNTVLGGVVGLAFGALLAWQGIARLPLALLIGGGAGFLVTLLVLGLHHQFAHRSAEPDGGQKP